jgi:hypothetical protein
MKTILRACIVLLLATAAALANGQVYRCGPDGRQYSQAPCPSGTAVDVADPRTPDQQREAKSASARDARLAHELVRERRARETSTQAHGVAYLGPTRAGVGAESTGAQHKRKRKADQKAGADSQLTPPLRIAAERR